MLPIPANSLNVISDLKSFTGTTPGQVIILLGYYNPNDGGGGEFYWVSTTGTDDGGSVINPTSGPGSWLRVFPDGYVNVKWFGATGDGVTHDLSFIQNALAYCISSGLILRFDDSSYYLEGTFTIPALTLTKLLVIQFNETTLVTAPTIMSTTAPIILIDSVIGPFALLGNLNLYVNISGISGPGVNLIDGIKITNCNQFFIDTVSTNGARYGVQLGYCKDVIINNIEGYNNQGFQDSSANGGSIFTCYGCNNIRIKQITGSNCWKAAIYLSLDTNEMGDFDNQDIQIDSADIQLSMGSTIANGLAIRSCVNLQVGSLRVLNGISAVYAELNLQYRKVQNIHINSVIATKCVAASSVSNAIRIANLTGGSTASTSPMTNFKIDKVSIDGGNQPSIYIYNVSDVYIGAATITNIPSNAIWLQNSNHVYFDYINLVKSNGHGILIDGTGTAPNTVSDLYINNYYFNNLGNTANCGIQVSNGSLSSCYINNIIGTGTFLYCFYYAVPNSTDQLQIGNIVNSGGSGGTAFYRATVFSAVKNSFFCNSAPPTSIAATWNAGDVILSTNSASGSEYGFRCIVSGTPGNWANVALSSSGTSVQSGTGLLGTFTITHALGVIPSYVDVQPGSINAANIQYVTVNTTNMIVHYTTAPVAGTNNLTFYWTANV